MRSVTAESYIRYQGKKIYLETPYYYLKQLMNNNSKTIEVEASGLITGKTKVFYKKYISDYGEA